MRRNFFLARSGNIFFGRQAVTRTLPCLKLKTELWKRGIRQIDLALDIKVDPSRISKIINGREEPTPEIKKQISNYLQMSEGELF